MAPLAAISAVLLAATAVGGGEPLTVWFGEQGPQISDRLALLCANQGAEIAEQDDRHVLCRKPVTGGRGILAQALLGNSSSTSPTLMVRFSILRDGKASRVQASQWIELQMAGGQVRRTELDSQKQQRAMEDALVQAGAHTVHPDDLPSTAAPGIEGKSATP